MSLKTAPLFPTFLEWWRRELRAALPEPVRRLVVPARPVLEAVIERGAVRLVTDSGDGRRELCLVADPLTDPPARRIRRRIARAARDAAETVLRLPAEQVLRPCLRLPTGAADALDETLAREMDRHTPFAAHDVRYDWRVSGSDIELEQLFVELLVARRTDVEEAVARARAVGLEPDRVDGPALGSAAFDLARAEHAGTRRRQAGSRMLRPLAAVAVAVAVALPLLSIERREAELAAIETAIAPLREAAAEVAALEERRAALRSTGAFLLERKRSRPPAIAILDEVTRRVPDGDWLEGLSFQGGVVRMEGYSADAARLPALLEESEMLTNVAFAAPLQRQAELGVDRFSITATASAEVAK